MATYLRIALLVALAVAFQQVFAEEAGTKSYSAFNLIIESGFVEYILILLSVVGISVGIHRMLTIKREVLVPEGLADDLHNLFQDGVTDETVDEALNMVSGDQSILGECLAAALDKRDFGYDSMAEAAETVGAAEHNKYMSQISWLSLFAAIGPMLGLLGTVVGMIGAFLVMASKGTVKPDDLAGDIGGAMITTATGLIIAIPMMFFFFFLRARVNACVLDAGVLVGEILDYFREK